jgi:hypothetical protein
MKLTRAERLVIARIVNVKMSESLTLKDHILLEQIWKVTRPEEVSLRVPIDFVKEDEKDLFAKYDGQAINSIENEEHKRIISEAVQRARILEVEVFSNKDEGEEIQLTNEHIRILKEFYDKDKRPFPKEYHVAILGLHEKLTGEKK